MPYRCSWTAGALLAATLLVAPAAPLLADTHPADPPMPGHGPAPMHDAMEHPGHAGAAPHAAAEAELDPVIRAFQEANERMHAAMSAPMTGDADRDFAVAMIAHHEGAIEMAEILLEYGHDPELRALAEEVIEVQQQEIDLLRRWLEENPQ